MRASRLEKLLNNPPKGDYAVIGLASGMPQNKQEQATSFRVMGIVIAYLHECVLDKIPSNVYIL